MLCRLAPQQQLDPQQQRSSTAAPAASRFLSPEGRAAGLARAVYLSHLLLLLDWRLLLQMHVHTAQHDLVQHAAWRAAWAPQGSVLEVRVGGAVSAERSWRQCPAHTSACAASSHCCVHPPITAPQTEVAADLAQPKMFLQGVDAAGRPLLLLLARHHTLTANGPQQRYITYCLDVAIASADARANPANPDGKVVGVFDLRGG